MGGKSTIYGSGGTASADDGEATVLLGQNPPAEPRPAGSSDPQAQQPAPPPAPPPPAEVLAPASATEVVQPRTVAAIHEPHPPTEPAAPHPQGVAVPPQTVARIVRYGPGVPVVLPENQGGRTAEHVWRGQPPAGRRKQRLRTVAGSALTIILLAASGVVFYLRFYHPPLQVSGAVIAQRAPVRCGVRLTGRISTNGAAGTVSYQWLFRPGGQPPTRLSQTVAAGQHSVNVVAAVEGSGSGDVAQAVTLQVLGPERATASADVVVRC
jgi:hypothetical protein